MSFQETVREDQRLVVLRCLAEAPKYSANESVLSTGLEIWGHRISRAQIVGQIDWLEQAGLVTFEKITSSIRIVTLTAHGQDVAEGRVHYTGVKKPRARQ